jgi:parvulin-like peptidyl-prolyl isomerase
MTIRVNGQVIPEKAIITELKRLIDFYNRHMSRAEIARNMGDLAKRAKDHAVGTQLLIDEVKRRHIEVPEAEVMAAVQDMVKKVGGEQPLESVLARQGMTRQQLVASVRAGKQLDRLVDRVASAEPECTEKELREFFDEHPDHYATPDKAQLRHVLIRPPTSGETDKAATRSRLAGLRQQLVEGGTFSEIASAHSECPSGKEAGGELGWISRGTTVPEFDQAVFEQLEVGDISDVIETPLGFHIVEKLDQEEGEPLTFEEAHDRIRDLLTHERRGRALTRFVEKLREAAVIEEEGEEGPGKWDALLDSFLDGEKDS